MLKRHAKSMFGTTFLPSVMVGRSFQNRHTVEIIDLFWTSGYRDGHADRA